MPNKRFSERLNRELDNIGVPEPAEERVQILAKLIKVPRFQAEALLHGNNPNPTVLKTLANELEVNADWLLGKTDSKDMN